MAAEGRRCHNRPMFIEVFGAVRSAQEWSLRAPRHQGEFVFGPKSRETVVFGVFGDSVGCGLGVSSVERTFAGSVARRLAVRRRVVCRIRAVSGARGRGLALQRPAGDERYAAISIGTNDIIHGESFSRLEMEVRVFIERLGRAERVVVLGPGDLASATIVPPVLRRVIGARVRACEDALRRAVRRFPHARHFGPEDLDLPLTPAHYAPDGFHPSESAHALIADAVLDRLTG
jgi:lysophospholipase L1-like esterase